MVTKLSYRTKGHSRGLCMAEAQQMQWIKEGIYALRPRQGYRVLKFVANQVRRVAIRSWTY